MLPRIPYDDLIPLPDMAQHQAYSAQDYDDLGAASKLHGDLQVLLQLTPRELASSASRWTLRHLIAYRLLVRPEAAFLPVLRTDHDQRCPVCSPGGHQYYPQTIDRARTDTLTGTTPRNLCLKTEHELMQLPHGVLWVALARAARPELTGQPRAYPRRERKQAQREGYVNSADAIPESSSPIEESSSEFDADTSHVDDDEHDVRRNKPEEVTANLVSSFLQQALSVCLLQHPDGLTAQVEVRPRVERRMTIAVVTGHVSITAEDDGGICLMRRTDLGWQMSHPYWALLEAKRAFDRVDFDGNKGAYVPTVSDSNLAQYLGEAIITWKGNQSLLPHGVFLIAATNTFMRFTKFSFSRDYLRYLDATTVGAQLEMISDPGKEVFVSMQSSTWFNLQSSDGRRAALCHILALLRWHDAEGSMHHGGDADPDDGDGEDGPSSSYEVNDDTESEMDDGDDMDIGE
ncbi:hypothetical protein B0T16DRAFT_246005 [Cercophora newfieldiana]|uniref:Uncharacterized protein n=1 Tax=Cercophora newfieldiana TaxID=92897 RepID=A0AA39XUC1_9PEZI|nr:hypothetical protein B0T16DRAFT_246005 [Cercophora newfieldiana]